MNVSRSVVPPRDSKQVRAVVARPLDRVLGQVELVSDPLDADVSRDVDGAPIEPVQNLLAGPVVESLTRAER